MNLFAFSGISLFPRDAIRSFLWRVLQYLMISVAAATGSSACAQVDFEKTPINYHRSTPNDRLARLDARIESGDLDLRYSPEHGWLPSLLEALEIDVDSQTLVFSKTSLQLHKISPRTPRALYFNDDTYVGWCQGGDVIEVAATDRQLGAVFYTIPQANSGRPEIQRDQGHCLACHANYRTQGVPGYLIRSVFPDFNGRPRTGTRTYITDHSSEFEKRYGGWYVSGKHGSMRHMANVIAEDRLDPEVIDRERGANLDSLEHLFSVQPYLTPHSDIVALMVLEHQTQMHNLIARASMETRIAEDQDRGINVALGRPANFQSESTERRIANAGEKLVRYLLFADEQVLPSPVRGPSRFREQFESLKHPKAKTDRVGRSLRQFDLQTRLFRYPCSFLIYSEAFDAMPDQMAIWIQDRISEVLFSAEGEVGYEQLSAESRQAIAEILRETKPGYLRD